MNKAISCKGRLQISWVILIFSGKYDEYNNVLYISLEDLERQLI